MSTKYLSLSGLTYFWGKIKNWVSSVLPTKTSDLTNDSEFITNAVNDLVNYYKKTETYTKTEVNSLIGAISNFSWKIVGTLPDVGSSNILYLVGPTGTGADKYEEYVWSDDKFEKIGDTSIDVRGKADKVANATSGNFASLDYAGNLVDSGKKAADFLLASDLVDITNAEIDAICV